jgi:hypothetical protein
MAADTGYFDYELQVGTWVGWYWVVSTVPIGSFANGYARSQR